MLAYRIQGQGRPLLLIHGWGVTYTVWNQLVPALARHFQVILVELPGMGASSSAMPATTPYFEASADALEELREALGVARWSLFSYSVGTLVAEAYLRKYPARVARAAFICPIYIGWRWSALLRLARWLDRRTPRSLVWLISGWRLRVAVQTLGFNLRWGPGAAEWTKEIALQPAHHLKRMFFELPGDGCAPYLAAIARRIPALFIWGQRDVMCARSTPTGPHEVFLPINHAAPESDPDAVSTVALPFLLAEDAQDARDEEDARQPVELERRDSGR